MLSHVRRSCETLARPNLRLYWRIICVLRASVVTKARKPVHHEDTENTEKPVGRYTGQNTSSG
jgi:hypothetical protein